MYKFFKKPKLDQERDVRELLRENLNLLEMDIFYQKDPLLSLKKEERLLYLKKFADIYTDKVFMERLNYMINRQAEKTLYNSGSGIQDIAGAQNINGIATVMDEVKRLANLHLKESTIVDDTPIDKFAIIPTVNRL